MVFSASSPFISCVSRSRLKKRPCRRTRNASITFGSGERVDRKIDRLHPEGKLKGELSKVSRNDAIQVLLQVHEKRILSPIISLYLSQNRRIRSSWSTDLPRVIVRLCSQSNRSLIHMPKQARKPVISGDGARYPLVDYFRTWQF